MRILFVCAQSPWPPRSGTPLRSRGWIKTAAQLADVGLVALTRSSLEAEQALAARRYCAYVNIVLDPQTQPRRFLRRTLALATLTPFYYREYFSEALRQAVIRAVAEWDPDLVQAEWIGSLSGLTPDLIASRPTLYSAHNLEYRVIAGPSGSWRRRLAGPFAWRLAGMERGWAGQMTGISAVARTEADWFKAVNPRTYLVPNALVVREYPFQPPPIRQEGPVAFIGHLGYPPNKAAAMVLARRVFPRIRKQQPNRECLIAGRVPDQRIRSLAGEGVEICGEVEDMATVWARISLLISPLTWGAGSRFKLLEAAAWGVPIVATPVSAEGLNFKPDRDYLAATSPRELADKALELLDNPSRAAALACQARQTLLAGHDWDGLLPTLARLYADLLGARSPGRSESAG